MDSASVINAWIAGGSNGLGILLRSRTLPAGNTTGSWKGCRLTGQRRSGLLGGGNSGPCAKGKKFFHFGRIVAKSHEEQTAQLNRTIAKLLLSQVCTFTAQTVQISTGRKHPAHREAIGIAVFLFTGKRALELTY